MDDLSVTAVTKESTGSKCNAFEQYSGKLTLGHRHAECRVHRASPAGNSPKCAASEEPAFLCREARLQDSLGTSSYPVFLEPRTSTEVLVTSHTGKHGALCSGSITQRESVNELTGQCFTPKSQGPWELSSRNNARYLASFAVTI